MRVILSDDLFDGATSVTALAALFNLAHRGRHRMLLREHARYDAWIEAREVQLREEFENALRWSVEAEAREPAYTQMQVIASGPSEWDAPTPRLTLIEAQGVLEQPFVLLLEDPESDRHFFWCAARGPHRKRLEELNRGRWLHFECVGGISQIERYVRRVREECPRELWRYWAMFDHDGRVPEAPSRDSSKLAEACGTEVRHHRLHRRAIENYLPRVALEKAAGGRADRVAKVEALFHPFMTEVPARRHHFHMKKGLDGDSPAADHYRDLPTELRTHLKKGFENIGELFSDGSVTEADLHRDGAFDELDAMIESLIQRLR